MEQQNLFNVASGVWSLQCQYNFKKQGTWTPSATVGVDYLVVAGGGGGGGFSGEQEEVEQVVIELHFQVEQKLTLENGTSYPITVGAGGAGGSGTSTPGVWN
jgi:hypothetical protein